MISKEHFQNDFLKELNTRPVIVASYAKKNLEFTKQWTSTTFSLKTTCRTMDNDVYKNHCSLNLKNKSYKHFCLNDNVNQPSSFIHPKPKKRLSITDKTNTNLFRLSALKNDLIDINKKCLSVDKSFNEEICENKDNIQPSENLVNIIKLNNKETKNIHELSLPDLKNDELCKKDIISIDTSFNMPSCSMNKIETNLKPIENEISLEKSISKTNEMLSIEKTVDIDEKIELNQSTIEKSNCKNELSEVKKESNLLDYLKDNQIKQTKNIILSNDHQYNFEQQTDNLVEEIYFSAELRDQQKSIQTILNDKSSTNNNVSITKIQLAAQTDNSSFDNKKIIDNEFELESNLSTESLSKYPDDGVDLNKNIEEEELEDVNNKIINSEDICKTSVKSVDSGTSSCSVDYSQDYLVVVAIDFGTTYSGYAFSFVREQDPQIHMMRNPIQHDNLTSHKAPTALLLTPNGNFNSFGQLAKETYHNLSNEQAAKWLFFDKFKMTLHRLDGEELTKNSTIQAANGIQVKALTVFSLALKYFRKLASEQLEQQCGCVVKLESIRWVVTVPAIWKQPAKQFMRLAAYEAGLASEQRPNQLLIALEPEAASIYCRKLKLNQLIKPEISFLIPNSSASKKNSTTNNNKNKVSQNSLLENCFDKGTRYLVVDCGGGTVDITVHEIQDIKGQIKEIYKATGGPFGSVGIDKEFELTLMKIFGQEFIEQYKLKYPSGFVDLMNSFEARKRSAVTHTSQDITQSLNITLPFSFINAFKKYKNGSLDQYLKRFYTSNRDFVEKDEISYCSKLGMIRLQPSFMIKLFKPITNEIVKHISKVINNEEVNNKENPLKYLFLVGGFSESQILQSVIRNAFICQNSISVSEKKSSDENKKESSSIETKLSTEKNFKLKELSTFKKSFNKLINKSSAPSKKKELIEMTSNEIEQKTQNDSNKCKQLKVIIPQDVSSAILRGAVLYGLDPNVITVRRSRLTYGIGVLNKFQKDIHPQNKLIVRDGVNWCTDVFDKFVTCDQSIALGECVQRSYTPAKLGQKYTVLHIYCSETDNAHFVTDPGISRCGSLVLELESVNMSKTETSKQEVNDEDLKNNNEIVNREILTKMIFGDTEIKVKAIDVGTGKFVKAEVDFLSH